MDTLQRAAGWLRQRAHALASGVGAGRGHARHRRRRAARHRAGADGRAPAARSRSTSIRPARSSCSAGSTTARCTADRRPVSCSTRPAKPASIATAIDGHAMARQGRGAAALTTAAIGSFVAGTLATLGLTFFAPLLASVALRFGPAEYFALTVLAFCAVTSLLGASIAARPVQPFFRAGARPCRDRPAHRRARFSFGIPQLLDGIDVVILVIGLFAVGEALYQAWRHGREEMDVVTLHDFAGMNREEWKRSWKPWLRGTAIGFPLGVLPMGGSVIPTFLSYITEKRLSPHPEEFGHGAIEGVAGPEAANNAAAAGSRAAPDARPPLLGDGRDHSGGVPAVRTSAWPAALLLAPGSRLDADCEPLHRQRDAPDSESAARRPVGARDAGAAAAAVRGVLVLSSWGPTV